MGLSAKQKQAVADFIKAGGSTQESTDAYLATLSEDGQKAFADSIMARPELDRRFQSIAQKEAENDRKYTAAFEQLGVMKLEAERAAAERGNTQALQIKRKFEGQLLKVAQTFGLSKEDVMAGLEADLETMPQQNYTPPPVQQSNQPRNDQGQFITKDELKAAEISVNNTFLETERTRVKYRREFPDLDLDLAAAVDYGRQHGHKSIDAAIEDFYDLNALRKQKQDAEVNARIAAGVAAELAKREDADTSDMYRPGGQVPANQPPSELQKTLAILREPVTHAAIAPAGQVPVAPPSSSVDFQARIRRIEREANKNGWNPDAVFNG